MTLPTFAVVSAIYNVGRYLEDFFQSLDRQSLDSTRLHVVLVIDGATDDSLERCERWKAETKRRVTIITKENGGQASARNRGLEAVEEDWVTFIDPDDFVSDGYFEEVAEQISAHPDAVMAVTHLKDFHEKDVEIRDSHPLRYRFKGGNKLVDLDRFPGHTHLSASSAFFRTETVANSVLRFDELLRPVFEDAHFVQRYLLYSASPMVVFVDTAEYYYRRRADRSSTLQNAATDPNKYTTVVERGLLSLLREASNLGKVPKWLQYAVIYELAWTFRAEEAVAPVTAGVEGEAAAKFHQLLTEVRKYLDDAAIDDFPLIRRTGSQVEVLKYGYSQEAWHWPEITVARYVKERNLVELRYRFTGELPAERILFRGQEVKPYSAKTRTIPFLRSGRLHERVIWMPANGTIAVELNGVPAPLSFKYPEQKKFSLRPAEIAAFSPQTQSRPALVRNRPKRKLGDRAVEVLADSSAVKRLFAGAWVLMDRPGLANDNAEHLFKYLRRHRRDINAWFVLEKNSADWKRLKKLGYKRLISYGSAMWKALCLNASFIISSHADALVVSPFVTDRGRKPTWRFVFLQHGVLGNDLSNWLNTKTIDLMVASCDQEYASLCGNGSNYRLSPVNVVLTGLPRYDRLRVWNGEFGRKPRYITVMPTWRQYLTASSDQKTGQREYRPEVLNSEFVQKWLHVLGSPSLRQLAVECGLTINFMPHPNLEPLMRHMSLPDYLTVSSYARDDVQNILVDSAAVITDYSSIAFDAALIERPVIYYQFDREDVLGGKHTTKSGHFSYDAHGFGPVVKSCNDLVGSLREILDGSSPARARFQQRSRDFFAGIPEESCRAVTEDILNLSVPVKPRQAFAHPLETPEAPPIQYFN